MLGVSLVVLRGVAGDAGAARKKSISTPLLNHGTLNYFLFFTTGWGVK